MSAPVTIEAPALAGVLEWWDEHRHEVPWRARRDVYAIWVAEVMSAQTTLQRAVGGWERWIARWPDVETLAAATLVDVLAEWQGLGYPRRARDLHRSARLVVEHGWPDDLTELPGVGPYVADAIRCFALEQPVLPRDVNVRRVLARRFPAGVDTSADPWRAGQALMEFGQRICRLRPDCASCPVADGCDGPDAGDARAGARGARARRQPRFEGSLRQRRGRLLARVIATREVALATLSPDDAQAARSLAADGLARLSDGRLRAPE